jgi:DNA (cytosine-5)-methyltransferase 1
LGQTGGNGGYVNDVGQPLTTITTKAEHLLVSPLLAPVKTWGGGGNDAAPPDRPMRTVTTSKRGEHALVVPTLIQTGYGEREGQAPRVPGLHKPLGTVVADGQKHALVAAFLAKHYGGGENGQQTPGSQMTLPMGTVTAVDHHALVASSLVKLKGTCRDGQPVSEPLGTVQAQGRHYAEVRAFLMAYYSADQDAQLGLPMPTATTRDRFAVVTVAGVDYAIVDIGMRMLTPRELFNAQGFPPDYVIDAQHGGKPLTKTAQVAKCGNSVPPPFSAALVRAQYHQEDAGAR